MLLKFNFTDLTYSILKPIYKLKKSSDENKLWFFNIFKQRNEQTFRIFIYHIYIMIILLG